MFLGGLKIFSHHKIIKKKNLRKSKEKFTNLHLEYVLKEASYDNIYDFPEGRNAHARNADTFNLRKRIIAQFEKNFPTEISSKEINRGRKFLKSLQRP